MINLKTIGRIERRIRDQLGDSPGPGFHMGVKVFTCRYCNGRFRTECFVQKACSLKAGDPECYRRNKSKNQQRAYKKFRRVNRKRIKEKRKEYYAREKK